MPRGRPRQFDLDQALTSAMETFWAKGFQASSMTDLTEAMGIASPSLYAAFGSKERLFESALAHYCAHHGGDMWERLDRGKTIAVAIEDFLMTSVDVFTDRTHPPGCMVVSAVNEITAESNTAAWRAVQALWESNQRQLAERFERAKREHDLKEGVDIDAAATAILALQSGLSNAARMGKSNRELRNAAQLGCDLIQSLVRE